VLHPRAHAQRRVLLRKPGLEAGAVTRGWWCANVQEGQCACPAATAGRAERMLRCVSAVHYCRGGLCIRWGNRQRVIGCRTHGRAVGVCNGCCHAWHARAQTLMCQVCPGHTDSSKCAAHNVTTCQHTEHSNRHTCAATTLFVSARDWRCVHAHGFSSA
jgi:hypothetical protein